MSTPGDLLKEAEAGGRVYVTASITLQDATLVGNADDPSIIDLSRGGRLVVQGIVTISQVTLTGGSNPNGSGGAINVARRANLTLLNSTVSGNVARSGGAINTTSPSTLTIKDSTIENNTAATDGGGILNNGTLTIENSTINNNTATKKGGGLRDNGPDTKIVNSTFVENIASQGGALSSTGSTKITHATIVRNQATSSSSAGVDRNGGTLTVSYSIIGSNTRDNGSPASDCSGTPNLVDKNLLSVLSGCNPVGEYRLADPVLDLRIGPLTDNGGPTKTVALLDGSKALDWIEPISTTITRCKASSNRPNNPVTVDQRGTTRPYGSGCDLGAVERSMLALDTTLAVDAPKYAALPRVGGVPTVEVGLTNVAVDDALDTIVAASAAEPDNTTTKDSALRSIALRSITVEDIALRSIDTKAAALRSIALQSIALRSIALRSIALRSIALRSIALRSIPLSEIPLVDDNWSSYLDGTRFEGMPLQSVTLEDLQSLPADPDLTDDIKFTAVNLDGLSLESIDLSSTALRSIALRSIALRSIALRSIRIDGYDLVDGSYSSAWCQILLGSDPAACDPATDAGKATIAAVGSADLLTMQLSGADVDAVPVFDIPLSGLAQATTTTIEDAAPRSIALRSIALRSIYIENTALRSIALRSIAAAGSTYINSIIDCDSAPDYCAYNPTDTTINPFTLGDAAANDKLRVYAADPVTGAVGNLIDLPASVLEGISLGDLLLALSPPEVSPWEQLDLDNVLLQNVGEPPQDTFDYVTTIQVKESAADLAVDLTLPAGFAVATRANEFSTFDGTEVDRTNVGLSTAKFTILNVAPGSHELRVPVRAGTRTNAYVANDGRLVVDPIAAGASHPLTARVDVAATSGSTIVAAHDEAVVNVVAAQDAGGAITSTSLTFGDLRLAHVSSNEDADLYSFRLPAGPIPEGAPRPGDAARILLSNIAPGADYDLAIYEPAAAPLRQDLGAGAEQLTSIGEVRYDLNPTDDSYPTDIVDDIATNIPARFGHDGYVPRDISSRRSNADEEVMIPSLKADTTYYVAVTPYLGSSSNLPYGLRLRVDQTQSLPACGGPRTFPSELPTYPLHPTDVPTIVPTDANTLYITNTQWLAGEVGESTAKEILRAAADTTGTNGVIAGVIALDDDVAVRTAYAAWAKSPNRCSPDARNDVVREIGRVIDNITKTGNIDNIVILGGDGVVPMAAVPDRTGYSNESTFARDILTDDGNSNEVSGTLGAGYLLSDDPYATDAGIEINGADHELFVPTRAIGRLVEEGQQILDQLTNFVAFDGRLDPRTLPGSSPKTADVTGYDFLSDGAAEVAQTLELAATVRPPLNNDTWDKDDYLALFATRGSDIISPNAHYDYESLLPAAKDGTAFSSSDLVSTSDFVNDDDSTTTSGDFGFRLPDRSVIFSMGCHAGLSVSDVQLGVTALDWAELYADGDNPWLAHTTFGYGDTEIVAYSERLAVLFAEQLVALTKGVAGPQSLGDAIRIAKNDYLASTLVLSPYDEKILQSFTYYGLPMYTVGGTDTSRQGFAGAFTAQANEGESVESPVSFGTPIVDPNPDDTVVVLTRTPVTVGLTDNDGSSGATNLHLVTPVDGNGAYYEVDRNTVTAQYRPVQPLVDAEIPSTVGPTAGFLITGLTSVDKEKFTPRYLRPTVDLDANERRIEPTDGSFPATLQRVTTDGSGGQRLLLAAGQYADVTTETPNGPVTAGRQRLLTSIRGELYEKGLESDGVGPSFSRIDGNFGVNDGAVFFEVDTDSPAERVVVVYRKGTDTQWRSLDLFRRIAGGNTWFGGLPSTTNVEYFVQAVDSDGDVGISSNKVENFFTADPDNIGDLDIELTISNTTQYVGGYYTGPVSFVIVPSSDPGVDYVIEYSLDGQPFDVYAGQAPLVEGDGGHVVFARDSLGNQQFLYFVIDGSGPVLTGERSPDPVGGWSKGTVEVLFSAIDVGQAGVDKIVYSCSPAVVVTNLGGTDKTLCSLETPGETLGSAASILVTANGITTVTATAYDKAGNASADKAVEVKIDTTKPTLDYTVTSAVAGDNGYQRATAKVTLIPGDAESGIADNATTYTITSGTTTTEPTNYTAPFQLVNGVYTIEATTSNRAGIPYTITFPVKVDSKAPTLPAVTVPLGYVSAPVSVTLKPTDPAPGSGIAKIRVNGVDNPTIGTLTVTADQEGVNSFAATAYDLAGNPSNEITFQVKIDRTAPVVTATVPAPARGTDGLDYIRSDIPGQLALGQKIELVAVDAGIGVNGPIKYKITSGTTTSGPFDYNLPFGLATAGLNTVTAWATDALGNTNQSKPLVVSVNVDAAAPTIDATMPALTGIGQADQKLTYTCADPTPGSGLLASGGCQLLVNGKPPIAAPALNQTGRYEFALDTTTIGTTTFQITSTDNVGFVTTVTKTLRVGWRVCPLYDVTQVKSIGSNYTIKIQFCDQAGKIVKLPNGAKVTALTVDERNDPGPTFSGGSNDGYEFRLTRADSSYTYNLNTTGLLAGTHQLYLTTEPVICPAPTAALPRGCSLDQLQAQATNSAEFRLK